VPPPNVHHGAHSSYRDWLLQPWNRLYAGCTTVGALWKLRRSYSHRRSALLPRRASGSKEEAAAADAKQWVQAQLTICVAFVGLFGLLSLLNFNESASVRAFDGVLHENVVTLVSENEVTHDVFNDASNKLDDIGKLVSRLAACALLLKGDFLAGIAHPIGFEGARWVARYAKAFFHRDRPSTFFATDGAFPSSHTMRFVFCVAYVVVIAWPRLSTWNQKEQTESADEKTPRRVSLDNAALSVMMAWLFMGSLRIWADAHWWSDTCGGTLIGVQSIALSEAAIEGLPLVVAALMKWNDQRSKQ